MGCINRDENAVNNMVKIVKKYIEKKKRRLKFRRDYKFPEKIKNDNPNITISSSLKKAQLLLFIFFNGLFMGSSFLFLQGHRFIRYT